MAQIGTIKLQTAGGIVEVPVYELSDFGSEVYDMIRVQTGSGIGAIPFTKPADAEHNSLRVQTQNYGVLAAHNEASLMVDYNHSASFKTSYVQEVDYFEDGNLSEYDTQNQASISGTSHNGSYSVEVWGDGEAAEVLSTGGLPYYPKPGDEIGFWVLPRDDIYMNIAISPDIYVRMNRGNDSVAAHSGNTYKSTSHTVANDWYKWQVVWLSDNRLWADLFDSSGNHIHQFYFTDAAQTTGEVGVDFANSYSANMTAYGYLDHIGIHQHIEN